MSILMPTIEIAPEPAGRVDEKENMSGLYHGNLTALTLDLNRLLADVNLSETFDIRWPSSACTKDINEGIRARVMKNSRPTSLSLPLGDADGSSSVSASIEEFSVGRIEGYWSARVIPTNRVVDNDHLEYKPIMSHIVAGSREEGYADREIKRITLFRDVDEKMSLVYLCECFVKALDWRGGLDVPEVISRREDAMNANKRATDQTKLSQRFVSIMVGDLWTFPVCCVREVERWILQLNIGAQHFDVPNTQTRHTRHGKCACKKLQSVPGSRSYLIFSSDRVLSHIMRVLKLIDPNVVAEASSASRSRPSRLSANY